MRRPIVLLTLLALIWGASFMLIKIADRQLAPSTLILGRIGSAAVVLAAVAVWRLGVRETLVHLRAALLWLLVVALASTMVATIAVLPVGVIQAPAEMWHGETIMSILVLGVVGTALAYLIFFELIRTAGPNYATLVTYLVPPIALAYGAIFLGERFGIYAFVGLALILGGVALATGSVRVASLRGRRGAAIQLDSPRG